MSSRYSFLLSPRALEIGALLSLRSASDAACADPCLARTVGTTASFLSSLADEEELLEDLLLLLLPLLPETSSAATSTLALALEVELEDVGAFVLLALLLEVDVTLALSAVPLALEVVGALVLLTLLLDVDVALALSAVPLLLPVEELDFLFKSRIRNFRTKSKELSAHTTIRKSIPAKRDASNRLTSS